MVHVEGRREIHRKVSVEKPERKRLLGRPMCICNNNIYRGLKK
jgi:hypothetical protein